MGLDVIFSFFKSDEFIYFFNLFSPIIICFVGFNFTFKIFKKFLSIFIVNIEEDDIKNNINNNIDTDFLNNIDTLEDLSFNDDEPIIYYRK